MVVNGNKPQWTLVTSGIPQGSILGSILFVIYINDITEQLKSNIFLFADDTKTYKFIRNDPYDNAILQLDINKLIEWSNKCCYSFTLTNVKW